MAWYVQVSKEAHGKLAVHGKLERFQKRSDAEWFAQYQIHGWRVGQPRISAELFSGSNRNALTLRARVWKDTEGIQRITY